MILLHVVHDGGCEFAPSGMIFGHSVTSLNKQKRGSACKKARYSILVSLFFTPNTLQLPHSCGASGCGPRICMVGPHARVYSLGFVCIDR